MAALAACGAETVDSLDDDPNANGGTCVGPTELDVALTGTADDWALQDDASGAQSRDVAATCSVTSADAGQGTIDIVLSCSDDTHTDAAVSLALSGVPDGFPLALQAGGEVALDYHYSTPGHHVGGSEWAVLRDGVQGDLLLAVSRGSIYFGGGLPGITLDIDETVCEAPCAEDDLDCAEAWRVGVSAEGGDGQRVVVLDRARGELATDGGVYDIVVSRAERWVCLNCGDATDMLIAPKTRPSG